MSLKVVVTDGEFPDFDAERSVLGPLGVELIVENCTEPSEVLVAAKDADAILTQFAALNAEVIRGLAHCRAIVRYGVGVDNVDLEAARQRNMPVANVPDYCIDEVAEHTLALMLSLIRKLSEVREQVRQGVWDIAPTRPIHRLSGRILGLVGIGRIGTAVAVRAKAFGLKVLANDPGIAAATAIAAGIELTSLDDLLSRSDFVSLHAPGTSKNKHLLGDRTLQLMKPSAFVINCSRGSLVDLNALVTAIGAGRLAGAGLDVVESEPIDPTHPILSLPEVIVTSHCAWYSEESLRDLQRLAAAEVARGVLGQAMLHVVNGVR